MDGNGGLNLRNWGYYDESTTASSLKSHVRLENLPKMADVKPFSGGRDAMLMANVNGGFNQRDCGVSSSQYQMNYMRADAWIHRDNKFLNMLSTNPTNPNYAVLHDGTTVHHHHHHHPVQMLQQPESSADDNRVVHMDEIVAETESNNNAPSKKRAVGKSENSPKTKKSKKGVNAIKDEGGASVLRAKPVKKVTEVLINGINMDIGSIPIPVCSCTGAPQQCYKWGSGGWQSACCTTGMSQYPLPMSTKRRGARIAGRKMSLGAFKKVLEKLAAEGYNFSNPIDLKSYWAKHGTNKFVTIR